MNSREFSNNRISSNNEIYEKKTGVLKNFANPQENKILFQWSQRLCAYNFLKKEIAAQMFSCHLHNV